MNWSETNLTELNFSKLTTEELEDLKSYLLNLSDDEGLEKYFSIVDSYEFYGFVEGLSEERITELMGGPEKRAEHEAKEIFLALPEFSRLRNLSFGDDPDTEETMELNKKRLDQIEKEVNLIKEKLSKSESDKSDILKNDILKKLEKLETDIKFQKNEK